MRRGTEVSRAASIRYVQSMLRAIIKRALHGFHQQYRHANPSSQGILQLHFQYKKVDNNQLCAFGYYLLTCQIDLLPKINCLNSACRELRQLAWEVEIHRSKELHFSQAQFQIKSFSRVMWCIGTYCTTPLTTASWVNLATSAGQRRIRAASSGWQI